jgi:hypothetical protein
MEGKLYKVSSTKPVCAYGEMTIAGTRKPYSICGLGPNGVSIGRRAISPGKSAEHAVECTVFFVVKVWLIFSYEIADIVTGL